MLAPFFSYLTETERIFYIFAEKMKKFLKEFYLFFTGRAEEIPKMDDEELKQFDERLKNSIRNFK